MVCDTHVHVGRFYRMINVETFEDVDFYYEPRIVAETLKACGVDEFIFSSISCQRHVSLQEVKREARETQMVFGRGAHPFLWVTGCSMIQILTSMFSMKSFSRVSRYTNSKHHG